MKIFIFLSPVVLFVGCASNYKCRDSFAAGYKTGLITGRMEVWKQMEEIMRGIEGDKRK